MRLAFRISLENPPLACAEILALTKASAGTRFHDIFLIDTQEDPAWLQSRLAHTRAIHQLLFICAERDLTGCITDFDWQRIYRKDFHVAVHHASIPSSAIAELIGTRIKNATARMVGSRTDIHLFFHEGRVLCGRMLTQHTGKERTAKDRAAHYSATLQPKLARTLVNLTGARAGTLYDPLCGAGGILIEAGLMGLKPVGYEAYPSIAAKATANLAQAKIRNASVTARDALTLKRPMAYVAADLPYGRRTKRIDHKKFYAAILRMLKRNLRGRAVIMFPDSANVPALVRASRLKLVGIIDSYVHHALTRKIAILEP